MLWLFKGRLAGLFILYLVLFELYPSLFPITAEKAAEDYQPSRLIYDRNGTLLRESVNENGLRPYGFPLRKRTLF